MSLENLAVGRWSEPIESGGGVYLARNLEREESIVPAFEEIEGVVRQDLKRRRGDESLRRYLDDLRRQKPVAIDESLFQTEDNDL